MSDPIKVDIFFRANVGCDSGESDYLQYLKFVIQLIIIIPFGLLYLSFLVKIVKNKKNGDLFEDSFFTLHLVDGALTIYFLVLDISFFRVTSYIRPICELLVPKLKDPSYILTPFYTTYLYSQTAKIISTLAMCFNRYTSVKYPVHHKTLWIHHCKKVIFAIFFIPIFVIWPVAIGTTSFLPYNGSAIINYERIFPWFRTSYGRLAISIPTLIFVVFSSIVNSTKLRQLGSHMKKLEFSMNIATVFTACGFIFVVFLQISYLAVSTDRVTLVNYIVIATQFANDFYMLSGPVILLILDKRMRSSLCCGNKKTDSKRTTRISVQPISVKQSNIH